jgi:hypothetical protein
MRSIPILPALVVGPLRTFSAKARTEAVTPVTVAGGGVVTAEETSGNAITLPDDSLTHKADTHPTSPCPVRICSQVPALFLPSTVSGVPNGRTESLAALTLGPLRTLRKKALTCAVVAALP